MIYNVFTEEERINISAVNTKLEKIYMDLLDYKQDLTYIP